MLQKSSKAIGYSFLCLGLYAIFVKLFSNNVADYDLWGYFSFGRAFWEDGRFLFHDVFSYTPAKPHFSWGKFISWSCYPNCRIAMDGRYETVYQEYVYREYFDFLMGREKWNIFLRKYPHDMGLIRPNTKTYMLMLKESSWQVAYSDQGCVVFIRKELRDSLKINGNKKLSY